MITENIVLESSLKKQLKHLSIDNGLHVSTMLIDGAKYFLSTNSNIVPALFDSEEAFTMKIDEGLKQEIKTFCAEKDIRIKDFWNEVAHIVIKKEGVVSDV